MRNILRHIPLLGTIFIVACLFTAAVLLSSMSTTSVATASPISSTSLFATPSPERGYIADAENSLEIVMTGLNVGRPGINAVNMGTTKIRITASTARAYYSKGSPEYAAWSQVLSSATYLATSFSSNPFPGYGLPKGQAYDNLRAAVLAVP